MVDIFGTMFGANAGTGAVKTMTTVFTIFFVILIIGAIITVIVVLWLMSTQKIYGAKIYEKRKDNKYHPFIAKVIRKLSHDKLTGHYSWYIKRKGRKNEPITEPRDEFIERVDDGTGKIKEIIHLVKKDNDYTPINLNMKDDLLIDYEPMSFDMDLFRIEETQRRIEKYKNKPPWWQMMMPIFALIICALLIIVVCYFSFDNLTKQSAETHNFQVQMATQNAKIAKFMAIIVDQSNCKNLPIDQLFAEELGNSTTVPKG